MLDHIVSEKHGGDTILENLAWACFDCNRFKGSDIASLDRETGTLVPLYNPRLQFWSEHFRVSTGAIEALSQIGSVTERILRLNLPTGVEVRIELTLAGRYPT
ncbi:MAG: HNH endonuclease [Pirellula sp.]